MKRSLFLSTCVSLAMMSVTVLGAMDYGTLTATPVTHNSLQKNVRMVENNPQALWAGGSVQSRLLGAGTIGVTPYTVTIKQANVIHYAVVADITVGDGLWRTLGLATPNRITNTELQALGQYLNTHNQLWDMNYQVQTPFVKKGNTITGIVSVYNMVNGKMSKEWLYITFYNDKYSGLSARLVSVDEPSVKAVDKVVSALLTIK